MTAAAPPTAASLAPPPARSNQCMAYADRVEPGVFSFTHGRMTVWQAFEKLAVCWLGQGLGWVAVPRRPEGAD